MKTLLKFSLALGLLFGAGIHGEAQEPATLPHVPILPAKPEVVLACLPPVPKNWKLTKSWASNNYAIAAWQFTIACRKYVEVPPPSLPGQPPKVPGTTEIIVNDTGYWPNANRIFLDTKSPLGPNQERTTLDDYPMIRTQPAEEDGDEKLLLWVKERFLVSVTTSKQEMDSDEQWARLIDFKGLLQISDDGATQLPNLLTMSAVDELVPANTRSYQAYLHEFGPGTPGH